MKTPTTIETRLPHYVEDILEELAVLKSKVLRESAPYKAMLTSIVEEFVDLIKSDANNVQPLIRILVSFNEAETSDAVTHISRILTERG